MRVGLNQLVRTIMLLSLCIWTMTGCTYIEGLPESQRLSISLIPEPIPETTPTPSSEFHFVDLCDEIDNSNTCAIAIENYQLERHAETIKREDDTLYVSFPNTGNPVILQDTFNGKSGRIHNYREYLPSIGYHIIELSYSESRSYLLVGSSQNQRYEIASLPIISPDRKLFFTVISGRGMTKVEIWNRQAYMLNNSFLWRTANFHPKYISPKFNYAEQQIMAEWLDANLIKINMTDAKEVEVSAMIELDNDGYVERFELEY